MLFITADEFGNTTIRYTPDSYQGVLEYKKECSGHVTGTLVERKLVHGNKVINKKKIETSKVKYVDTKRDRILTENESVYKLDFGDTKNNVVLRGLRVDFYADLENVSVARILRAADE